jgi:hypothetical protein
MVQKLRNNLRKDIRRNIELTPPIVALGVLVVIALFGLTALFFNESNNVGSAVIYQRDAADFRADCFDTDPLNEYDVKGSVHYQNFVYHDQCSDDNVHLHQMYCQSSQRVGTTFGYPCPNGCQDGVCL